MQWSRNGGHGLTHPQVWKGFDLWKNLWPLQSGLSSYSTDWKWNMAFACTLLQLRLHQCGVHWLHVYNQWLTPALKTDLFTVGFTSFKVDLTTKFPSHYSLCFSSSDSQGNWKVLSNPVRVHMDGMTRVMLDSQVTAMRPSLEELLQLAPPCNSQQTSFMGWRGSTVKSMFVNFGSFWDSFCDVVNTLKGQTIY